VPEPVVSAPPAPAPEPVETPVAAETSVAAETESAAELRRHPIHGDPVVLEPQAEKPLEEGKTRKMGWWSKRKTG
jgi:hypothetical protein